jgi:hypothetical protein
MRILINNSRRAHECNNIVNGKKEGDNNNLLLAENGILQYIARNVVSQFIPKE